MSHRWETLFLTIVSKCWGLVLTACVKTIFWTERNGRRGSNFSRKVTTGLIAVMSEKKGLALQNEAHFDDNLQDLKLFLYCFY